MSLVPYASFGHRFGKLSYGSFGFTDALGYSFGAGSGRSDYFYNSFHLDLDVLDQHKLYPLVELNWFHYTSNGTTRPFFSFEGLDLANVGGSNKSRNFLSIAVGARYKITEAVQVGLAFEFPLFGGTRDLFGFRTTIDLIWR